MMFSFTSGPMRINRDGYLIALDLFKPLSAEIELLVNHGLKTIRQQLASVSTNYTLYAQPKLPKYNN